MKMFKFRIFPLWIVYGVTASLATCLYEFIRRNYVDRVGYDVTDFAVAGLVTFAICFPIAALVQRKNVLEISSSNVKGYMNPFYKDFISRKEISSLDHRLYFGRLKVVVIFSGNKKRRLYSFLFKDQDSLLSTVSSLRQLV